MDGWPDFFYTDKTGQKIVEMGNGTKLFLASTGSDRVLLGKFQQASYTTNAADVDGVRPCFVNTNLCSSDTYKSCCRMETPTLS